MQTITKQKLNKRQRYKRNRKIKRARLMKVSLGPSFDTSQGFYVCGDRDHFVVISSDGYTTCDCQNHEAPCSHVIAVRMYRGEWK